MEKYTGTKVVRALFTLFLALLIIMPFFLFAMYEKNGAEKILRHIYEAKFKRVKQRPYITNIFYTVLAWQRRPVKKCVGTNKPHGDHLFLRLCSG